MIWLVLRRSRPKPEKLEIKDVKPDELDGAALPPEPQLPALPRPEIDPEQQRIEQELVRMAKADPAMMAGLIRTWMNEDKKGH
jgi:flagellar biosynthesis/type III secretory pathway M-ring protein FliF/YscJ